MIGIDHMRMTEGRACGILEISVAGIVMRIAGYAITSITEDEVKNAPV